MPSSRHNAQEVSCGPVHARAQLPHAYESRPSSAQLPRLPGSFTGYVRLPIGECCSEMGWTGKLIGQWFIVAGR